MKIANYIYSTALFLIMGLLICFSGNAGGNTSETDNIKVANVSQSVDGNRESSSNVGNDSTAYAMLGESADISGENNIGNINEENVLSLPVHDIDKSSNGLWIDYANGVAQKNERFVQLDVSGVNSVKLEGWAADLANDSAFGCLYVRVGDKIFACEYGQENSTVADFYRSENLRYTGFNVNIPVKYFNSELKQLEFIAVSLDGSFRYEDMIYSAEIEGTPFLNSWIALAMIVAIVVIFLIAVIFMKNSSGNETFKKLKQNKFLFSELVKRDFTLRYKRTFLGMLWSMISPLVNLLIMWLVFDNLMGGNINHYVIYLFSGQLIFNYFNEATTMGMTSLVENSSIFTKVNVPKYLFLFSRNIASLINFGLTLIIYFIFVAVDGLAFNINFFALLYPILCLIILNVGLGMILSALFVFFRDMRYLWGLMSQLIMWLSVIFYSIEPLAPEVQELFLLNPVYLCIKYFRDVVINATIPDFNFHLLMALYSIVLLAVGCLIYKKKNREFLYYV